MHLPVLEDTGASVMKIHQSDRAYLERLSGAPVPVSGASTMGTAAGEIPVDNVVLQVNLYHNGQPMLPKWINVRACIGHDPPNAPPNLRLSGIWLHHMLYCLSLPDNSGRMYIGNDLTEILANAPTAACNPALARPPPV